MTVEYEDGSTGQFELTNGTGGIIGQVVTDAGFGLPDAIVVLLGTDETTTSNRTGWFQFLNVPAKEYVLHVSHSGYQAASSSVAVREGAVARVTITLLPRDDVRYQPHIHDSWGDRTEITVVDRSIPFHPSSPPTHGPVTAQYTLVYQTAFECVSPAGTLRPGSGAIFFDEPDQLVWPGTAEIKVTMSWDVTDFYGDRLFLAWKTADSKKFSQSPLLAKGETFSIPVLVNQTDSGHQAFTFWELAMCAPHWDDTAYNRGVRGGHPVLGEIDVTVTLVRGNPLLLDPAHPDFWINGSVVHVADSKKVLDSSSWTTHYNVLIQRQGAKESGWFYPTQSALVPPGTGNLVANLSWEYSVPVTNKPLSLTYSPASVPPWEKYALTDRMRTAPTEMGSNYRLYEVSVEPQETDAFYQEDSNWVFFWNEEGKEDSDSFVLSCGCQLTIRLTVDAVALETPASADGR